MSDFFDQSRSDRERHADERGERYYSTDTDGDGLEDWKEERLGTNRWKTDSDGDGIDDGDELSRSYGGVTDPTNPDTDGDGLSDKVDFAPNTFDYDGDGLSDGLEAVGPTSPYDSDSDDDGLSDGQEIGTRTDPTNPDTDGDGLSDGEEVADRLGRPDRADTDGDGLSDGEEAQIGTNPYRADTDRDGVSDFDEVQQGTNPNDTDGDGLADPDEVNIHDTDPDNPDSDEDGLSDGFEVGIGTNPNARDTDGDGVSDGLEVTGGTDPLVADGVGSPAQPLIDIGLSVGSDDTESDPATDPIDEEYEPVEYPDVPEPTEVFSPMPIVEPGSDQLTSYNTDDESAEVTDVYPVRDQHDPRDLLDGYVDSSQEPTGADPLRDDFQQYEHGLADGTLIDAPGAVVEPDPFDDPMGEPEETLEPFAPGAEFVTPPIEAPEVAEPFAEEALL